MPGAESLRNRRDREPDAASGNRRIKQPRGKVLGGSSAINAMLYVRGQAADYDGWAQRGNLGWSYRDVLPYFRKAEHCEFAGEDDEFHARGGPLNVSGLRNGYPALDLLIKAAQSCGYPHNPDYNGASQEGFATYQVTQKNGMRYSAKKAYLEAARRRPNLRVVTHAHVAGLVLEGAAGGAQRATGVTFHRHGRTERATAGQEVILSAGAIQSPQVLELSGIGNPDHLASHGVAVKHGLAGVGENLHDHLEVHIKHRSAAGSSQNGLLKPHRMLGIGLQWFLARRGPAATTPSRVGAFLRTAEDVAYPDIQYHFWPYFLDGWSPPPDKDGYCFDVGPVQTASRGWVRLASADPLAPPIMRLNGLQEEADRKVFRDSIRITREIAAQRAFDPLRGPEVAPGPEVTSDADLDAFVRANANSAYHVCGTCRMGQDELSVVAPDLRVHGIDGLRVIDAS
ncbi:MAG: GMC family oxidoreductase N-terminal domain-containing protein, partial [Pseudomonadota bacterium]|nr:GMC family oxidoreductase N-terminal domain-containing protein [Pseudomonadota bacterium]